MRYIIDDIKCRFKSDFDTESGACVRRGVPDEEETDTGIVPFAGFYPHLTVAGIMGHSMTGKTDLHSFGCSYLFLLMP